MNNVRLSQNLSCGRGALTLRHADCDDENPRGGGTPPTSGAQRAPLQSLRPLFAVLGLLCLAAPALRAEEQVIYPRTAAPAAAPAAHPASAYSPLLLVLALGAAAAGGWLLWRQRRQGGGVAGAPRKLAVTETRSLGSRQYLVVADYDGRKFLLGVCPGRIDLLAPLDGERK